MSVPPAKSESAKNRQWIGIVATAAVGIVGIAATFYAPTYVETKLEQREERRELRVAKRLVATELAAVAAIVSKGVEDGYGGDPNGPRVHPEFLPKPGDFRDSEWKAHRAVLAESLEDLDWGWLNWSYLAIEDMRRRAAKRPMGYLRAATPEHVIVINDALVKHEVRVMKKYEADVKKAVKILQDARAIHE